MFQGFKHKGMFNRVKGLVEAEKQNIAFLNEDITVTIRSGTNLVSLGINLLMPCFSLAAITTDDNL